MSEILFFGGTGNQNELTGRLNLNACDASLFVRALSSWIARVWVNETTVPTEGPELENFHEFRLIPIFRARYQTDGGRLRRGTTIEESWLSSQLTWRTPARCVLASPYAVSQPLGRVSRKTILEPVEFQQTLHHWFAAGGPPVFAMVHDGQQGHSIMVFGVDQDGRFRFYDPWPVRSLLCAEQNVAGVVADEDTEASGAWRVSGRDLQKVLVAVITGEHAWATMQIQKQFDVLWPAAQRLLGGSSDPPSSPTTMSLAPLIGIAAPPTLAKGEHAKALRAGLNWVTTEPYNRLAVSFSARILGLALLERNIVPEAAHWLRQAAMLGDRDAAVQLIDLLRASGDPFECAYWSSPDRRVLETSSTEYPSNTDIVARWLDFSSTFLAPSQLRPWEVEGAGAGAALRRAQAFAGRGNITEAEVAYREALEREDVEVSPRATIELARLLEDHGRLEEAEQLYRTAADTEHFYASVYGYHSLGRLLDDLGRNEEARAAKSRVVESGHFELAPGQALELGVVLRAEGHQINDALDYLKFATFSNDTEASAVAAYALADYYSSSQIELETVVYLLRRSVETNHPFRQEAAILLGDNLAEKGDRAAALDAYEIAANGEDMGVAQEARGALTRLRGSGL